MVSEYFHRLKRKLCSPSSHHLSPSPLFPQPQYNSNLLLSGEFPPLDISYEWNYIKYDFVYSVYFQDFFINVE
jgi:hypothetical protein